MICCWSKRGNEMMYKKCLREQENTHTKKWEKSQKRVQKERNSWSSNIRKRKEEGKEEKERGRKKERKEVFMLTGEERNKSGRSLSYNLMSQGSTWIPFSPFFLSFPSSILFSTLHPLILFLPLSLSFLSSSSFLSYFCHFANLFSLLEKERDSFLDPWNKSSRHWLAKYQYSVCVCVCVWVWVSVCVSLIQFKQWDKHVNMSLVSNTCKESLLSELYFKEQRVAHSHICLTFSFNSLFSSQVLFSLFPSFQTFFPFGTTIAPNTNGILMDGLH